MATLANLVTQHIQPWVTVGLYSNHKQMYYAPQVLADAIDTAVLMGAQRDKVCVLVPARCKEAEYFQKLLPANSTSCLEDRLCADAAWTTDPDAAIILPTADCQTIVIKNLVTGMLVVVHGGRAAMTPGSITENAEWNLLDLCLAKALEHADPTNLQIHVTGAISGKNFRHEQPRAQQLVQPFLELYGADVCVGDPADGCLDLFKVTQLVAARWKVPAEHITSDGICSYDDLRLASFRREENEQNRNIIIAANRQVQFA